MVNHRVSWNLTVPAAPGDVRVIMGRFMRRGITVRESVGLLGIRAEAAGFHLFGIALESGTATGSALTGAK